MTSKIKAILWTAKIPKSGICPIKIRVTTTTNGESKVKYYLTGGKCTIDQWDEGDCKVKKGHPMFQEINIKISEMKLKFEKNAFNGEDVRAEKQSFYWWYDQHLKTIEKTCTAKSYKKEVCIYNMLKRVTGPDLKVSQFDLMVVNEIESHMLAKGLCKNSVQDYFEKIRKPVKLMLNDGVMPYKKNPFSVKSFKKTKTEKNRLSFEEIIKFKNADLTGQMKKARDWYLISFYCSGVRCGDLFRLRKDNFVNGRIVYKMNKNGRKIDLPMPSEAIELLEEYDYECPYSVQLISEIKGKLHSDPIVDRKLKIDLIEKQIHNMTSLLGCSLKRACRKAEVTVVTPHTTRHSVAYHALRMGLTLGQIQGQLGHMYARTTDIYLKSLDTKDNDEGSKLLWNTSLTVVKEEAIPQSA